MRLLLEGCLARLVQAGLERPDSKFVNAGRTPAAGGVDSGDAFEGDAVSFGLEEEAESGFVVVAEVVGDFGLDEVAEVGLFVAPFADSADDGLDRSDELELAAVVFGVLELVGRVVREVVSHPRLNSC